MNENDYLGIDRIWTHLAAASTAARDAGDNSRREELYDVLDLIRSSVVHYAWCEANLPVPPTRAEQRRELHGALAEYAFQYDIAIPKALLDEPIAPAHAGRAVLRLTGFYLAIEPAGATVHGDNEPTHAANHWQLAMRPHCAREQPVDQAAGHYLMQCGCCDRETAVPVAAYEDSAISFWPCPGCHPAGGVDLDHAGRHAN